jgi:exodeoxyribonuclease VII small subunit
VETQQTFEGVSARLREIADAVSDEGISLDDALSLYEEAVKLGTQAADLCEEGIEPVD